MHPDVYLEAISRECDTFATVLERSSNLLVPSCPGWNVADLAVHLGVIHRWVAEMVRVGATAPIRDREALFGLESDSPELVAWFRSGAADLVEVLSSRPQEDPVWSWMPDGTVSFWLRRQAHEACVHRWDVQAAEGRPDPIEATLAADGIDEWLCVFAIPRSRKTSLLLGSGETFHLHCTDARGEWLIRFLDKDVSVERAHTRADLALRGAASDLLLFLWGRLSRDQLEVFGDPSLLARWRDLLPAI
jgi:uncharacterized protein (TIGR03083 family)